MTVTEREEDGEKVSNAIIEPIKEEEEEEEEIDQIKKEEEEEGDDDDEECDLDRLLNVPDGFNEFVDTALNEFVKESESSMKEMEESEEKARKRTRIAESKEAKAAQPRIGSGPAVDPLEITMEILSKYHDFVDFILEMLKKEEKYEEEMRWSEVLERGKHLIESLKQRLERLPDEMERMKNDENLQKEYSFRKTHIEDILAEMRDLNSRIDSPPHINFVSGVNFTVRVLPLCLDELQHSKEELSMLIEIIRELKEVNKEEEIIRVESE